MFALAAILFDGDLKRRTYFLDYCLWRDAVFFVICLLYPAAAACFVYCAFHGARHSVGIHNDLSARISCRSADCLDKRYFAAEEALLIGIQYRHERYLRKVEPFAEQVYADKHIKFPGAKPAQNIHAFDGVYIVMHIAAADPRKLEKFGKILRHLFCERCDKHSFVPFGAQTYFAGKIVDLPLCRAHLHLRIEQPRRADDLLDYILRNALFVFLRCRADIYRSAALFVEFIEGERAVVICGGQAEAVIHKVLFAHPVPMGHTAYLRQHDMAFVGEKYIIPREEIQQGIRRAARLSPGKHAGIVFDPGAEADLAYLLDIEHGAFSYALRLYKFVFGFEKGNSFIQLGNDLVQRLFALFLAGDIVRGGEYCGVGKIGDSLPRDGIYNAYALYFITEKLHAHGIRIGIGGEYFQNIPAHAEIISLEAHIASCVLHGDKPPDYIVTRVSRTAAERYDLLTVFLRIAQRINAGNRSDDDYIPTFNKSACRRMAQLIYFRIDRRILFDINILAGNISLRLVVIVIRHKEFHRVFGEERLHFAANLRGKRFVGFEYYCGAPRGGNDVCHGEGLAGARHADQGLIVQPVFDAVYKRCDRFGLIARRRKIRNEPEISHILIPFASNMRFNNIFYHIPVRNERYCAEISL